MGYYCPQGSVLPVGCPDGSYQDQVGKTYCKSCPAGYYCKNNASSYVNNECPVGMLHMGISCCWPFNCLHCVYNLVLYVILGHYCLVNTTQPKQFPCPSGTYNPKTAQTNQTACLNCKPGMYCEGNGNDSPTAECSAGWYCSGGDAFFQPPGGK